LEPAGYAGRRDEGHDCLIVAGPGCGVCLAKATVDVDLHCQSPDISIHVHDTISKCSEKAPTRRNRESLLIPVIEVC